jgi:hypothetical protein
VVYRRPVTQASPAERQLALPPAKGGEPMRDLPDVKLFPSGLNDDMHKAFEAVCAKLRLTPQSDKATALVVTRIVELAKAGRRGNDLRTLRTIAATILP